MAQRPLKKKKDLWSDNEIQFARLLCEIIATQDNFDIKALCDSMDLDEESVNELFDRAHDVFENAKKEI
jgi:hypothetical protein